MRPSGLELSLGVKLAPGRGRIIRRRRGLRGAGRKRQREKRRENQMKAPHLSFPYFSGRAHARRPLKSMALATELWPPCANRATRR